MGSVVTRIAALKTRKKNKTRVIYTAHGFHFYEGAPVMNWLVFYPTEKILARYTDTLITINQEDHKRAKSKFKTRVEYVPGVGIDEKKFNLKMSEFDKSELRKSLGLKHNDFVIIYPAELNTTKRQIWLINTVKNLINENPDIHLLLPGRDSLDGRCQKMAKEFHLENNIHFLGFRNDIPKLMNISNLSISTSNREGLPVNIIEAMYIGLPIIATDSRGNRDLIQNDINGFLVDLDDQENFIGRIKEVINNNPKISQLSNQAKLDSNTYTFNKIMKQISNIYNILTEEKYKVDNPILSIAQENFYEKLALHNNQSDKINRKNKR
jgi:glycosyltransferase EpsD